MIAIEPNLRVPKRSRLRPALELRFQFVDCSTATFVQPDVGAAEDILQRLNPYQLFKRNRIIVADDYSKSVFVCSQINRIDFVYDGLGFAHLPLDHADMVELTESEFRKHVPSNNFSNLQKRDQRRRVGDLLISFLTLRMQGGCQVHLMNEILVKPPVESQSYMKRLLSKSALGIRLAGGGESFLNLANLIGYTVYPGVPEVPVDTWIAQLKPADD